GRLLEAIAESRGALLELSAGVARGDALGLQRVDRRHHGPLVLAQPPALLVRGLELPLRLGELPLEPLGARLPVGQPRAALLELAGDRAEGRGPARDRIALRRRRGHGDTRRLDAAAEGAERRDQPVAELDQVA